MKRSRPVRFLLAIGSGAALAFSFPKFNLPLLAWIAVAMLMLAALGARVREAALYGFLAGAILYPISIPWIVTVMRQYGNVPVIPAVGILALMTFILALFLLVFAALVAQAGKSSIGLACLLAPFLWVALEFGRAEMPIIGFPWNLLGYAASGNLALVQLTSVTGIYGLSLVVAAFNSLLARAIVTPSRRSWMSTIGISVALVLIAWIGPRFVPHAAADHVAHLVQTNFPQAESYPTDWMDLHTSEMQQLETMSIDAARKSPGIIIWPEVPAPFSLQDPKFAAIAEDIAKNSPDGFLVGVVEWKLDARRQWQASNSAVLLGPTGRREFAYNKIHLVPFGEYVPFRKWLTFANSLVAGIGDFMPGHTYEVGGLPGRRFSVYICYEAIFPDLVRRFVVHGAGLLINISNDGWFGHEAAPAQHLMMARVRAVENRRWLLRCTNTGFTVDVDPYGRTVAQLAPYIRGELDAPYGFRTDLTPYARWGDWLVWCSMLMVILLLAWDFVKRGQRAGIR